MPNDKRNSLRFPDGLALQELLSKVQQMNQHAPGHLYSATRNLNVRSPDHRKAIQAEIDQMVGLYTVLHSIKLFESYWPNVQWAHECTDRHSGNTVPALDPNQVERLKAYRHIRHVAAHGMDGRRVDEVGDPIGDHRTEFETVMKSAHGIAAVTADDDFITVNPSAVFSDLQRVLTKAAQRGAAHAFQHHR